VNGHCDDVFCSLNCLRLGLRNGHLLECGVDYDTICELQQKPFDSVYLSSVSDKECASACAEFRRHSATTDELFLCARRVIVTLAAPLIFPPCNQASSPNSANEAIELLHCHFPSLSPADSANGPSEEDDTDGALYESWLLLSSSLLQLGVDQSIISPLMAYDFYRHLVKAVLPRHVKYVKCEGCDGLSPLQVRLLDACKDNEFEAWTQSIPSTDTGVIEEGWCMLEAVARKLFPSALTCTSTNDGGTSSSSSSRISPCPALSIMAAITSVGSTEDEDDGGTALEALSCTSLVLLSHTSRFARHSCLPTAQFFHTHDSNTDPLRPDTNGTSSSCAEDGDFITGSSSNRHPSENGRVFTASLLPSSTLIEVNVEAERDFTCTCVQEVVPCGAENIEARTWWKGNCLCCGECDDGLSISVLLDTASQAVPARNDSLRPLLSKSSSDTFKSENNLCCGCVRCRVESRPTGNDTMFSVSECDDLATLLSLGYLYMQSHQPHRARSILRGILEVQRQHKEKRIISNDANRCCGVDGGEIYHALGGCYLAEGNVLLLSRELVSIPNYINCMLYYLA
jgi:hypothetical protein